MKRKAQRKDGGFQEWIEVELSKVWAASDAYVVPWRVKTRTIAIKGKTITIPVEKAGCDLIVDVRGKIHYVEVKVTLVDRLPIGRLDTGIKVHQCCFLADMALRGRGSWVLWRCPAGDHLIPGGYPMGRWQEGSKSIKARDVEGFRVDIDKIWEAK